MISLMPNAKDKGEMRHQGKGAKSMCSVANSPGLWLFTVDEDLGVPHLCLSPGCIAYQTEEWY